METAERGRIDWPGWRDGECVITDTQHRFGIGLRFVRAETQMAWTAAHETALLLVSGRLRWAADGHSVEAQRRDWFAERPHALHVPGGTRMAIEPDGPIELAVVEVASQAAFRPRALEPSAVRAEQRGQGRLDGTAHREVRTVIDDVAGPPEARIVLGEVVNQPGRWSSYPPHHHPQAEVYHYRFTRPEGFGHAELDDEVLKVRDRSTLLIPPGTTHAQCAAPGYGMWYLWAIRHLDGQRYTGPTFDPTHAWVLDAR